MDTPEITELTDIQIDRVDGVPAAANGLPFLVLKAMGEPEIAADIAAAQAEVSKAAESTASIDDLPDSDFAFIESGGTKDDEAKTTPRSKRHFPIQDAAHVRNALARAPQSEFGDQAMPKIKAAAKRFGVDVAKADDGIPGSPSWEAADATSLRDIASALSALCERIEDAGDRERTEATSPVVADPDDFDNACDLDDASQAVDYALGIVARLAFTEAQEASEPSDDGSVTKAGKRLSTKSESAIRAARDALTALLGDGDDQAQTQEGDMTKEEMTAAVTEAIAPLTKALADMAAANTETSATDVAKSEATADGTEEAEVAKSDEATDAATAEATTTTEVAKADGSDAATAEESPVIKADEFAAVLKSTVEEAIKAAVSPLEKRLETVESQPVGGGPALNGVAKSAGAGFLALRGQAGEGTELAELTKALDAETDPVRKSEIANAISLRNLAARYGA